MFPKQVFGTAFCSTLSLEVPVWQDERRKEWRAQFNTALGNETWKFHGDYFFLDLTKKNKVIQCDLNG